MQKTCNNIKHNKTKLFSKLKNFLTPALISLPAGIVSASVHFDAIKKSLASKNLSEITFAQNNFLQGVSNNLQEVYHINIAPNVASFMIDLDSFHNNIIWSGYVGLSTRTNYINFITDFQNIKNTINNNLNEITFQFVDKTFVSNQSAIADFGTAVIIFATVVLLPVAINKIKKMAPQNQEIQK